MTAGTAATGARVWLAAKAPGWLTARRKRAATAVLLGVGVLAASTVGSATAKSGDGAKRVTSGSTAIWTWGVWIQKPSTNRLCMLHDWALPDERQTPSASQGAKNTPLVCAERRGGKWNSQIGTASVVGGDPDGEVSYEAGGYYGIVPAKTTRVKVVASRKKSTWVRYLTVYRAPQGFPGVKLFVGIASPNVHPTNVTKVRIEALSKSGKVLYRKTFAT